MSTLMIILPLAFGAVFGTWLFMTLILSIQQAGNSFITSLVIATTAICCAMVAIDYCSRVLVRRIEKREFSKNIAIGVLVAIVTGALIKGGMGARAAIEAGESHRAMALESMPMFLIGALAMMALGMVMARMGEAETPGIEQSSSPST